MKSRTLIVALAAVFSTVAVAQQPPRPDGPPPQGFERRQGGPGMGQRAPMGPPMGPALLLRPEVIKELKLTEDQIEDIEDLAPRPPMGMRRQGGPPGQPGQPGRPDEGRGGPPPQGEFGRRGQGGPPPMERRGMGGSPQGQPGQPMRFDRELKKILDESQFKRFKEIELNVHGAPALGRPDIAAKVGLSDDQVDEIHDILDAGFRPMEERGMRQRDRGDDRQGEPRRGGGEPPMRERQRDGRPGEGFEPGQMREEHKARRAEVEKKILAVLKADQLKAWKALLGKPFELAEPRAPRGGEDR